MSVIRQRSVTGVLLLLAVPLIGAACGSDDDDGADNIAATPPQTTAGAVETGSVPESTSGAPESTSATTAASTDAPPATPLATPSAEHPCPHVTNVVLVQNPDAADLNLPSNVDERQPDELPQLLGYEEYPDVSAGAVLAEMFEAGQLTAFEVSGEDALDKAQEFEDMNADVGGLVASPLLLLTMPGHWGMSPSGDPTETTQGSPPNNTFDSTGTVAVVDTGFTPASGEFQWLTDRVQGVDQTFDEDPGPPTFPADVVNHGKFVASVIVQESPNTSVRVARLGRYDNSFIPPEFQGVFTADELQLYIAIYRLLQLGDEYSALNLSLGAYACESDGDTGIDTSGLAIREAINLWNRRYQESPVPIIAAAGNHEPGNSDPLPAFLPAAYDTGPNDNMYSVMSTDVNGNQSDFSNSGLCGAWGERLVGVGSTIGVPGDRWVSWSGSSFAAALFTARTMLNGGVPDCDRLATPNVAITAPPTSTTTTTLG